MAEIISVRFKREGKQYYFDPQGLTVATGQAVIVETSWGLEYGECVRANCQVPEEEIVAPLRPVIRLAEEEDEAIVAKNKKKEAVAFQICREKIVEHQLEMKLVDVEYSFEGNKILFFFISEGRVDFRALVKNLASIFHTRIELRQIGVRDEAKLLGGLGICGRPFCCSSFLSEFQPVSIKMAKTQSLSLNPTKISGICGRLMCCLKYEQDAYEDLLKRTPKNDSFVETPDGVGTIISTNVLREKVKVRLDREQDSLRTYHNSEISIIRSGKGKRPDHYQEPPQEELERRRRLPPAGEEIPRSVPTEERETQPLMETEAKTYPQKRGNMGKKTPPITVEANETDESEKSHVAGKRNRSTKAASQAAIERALPGEDSGTEKKKNHYWRRKPNQGERKPPKS